MMKFVKKDSKFTLDEIEKAIISKVIQGGGPKTKKKKKKAGRMKLDINEGSDDE